MSAMTLRREMTVECRMEDEAKGIVTYRASDETLDSYREVILAAGWKFDNFKKNAPFVNSHDYGSIENLLGSVVAFGVDGKSLSNTVQWAVDVKENRLAQLGWKMTKAGHLKAVSVGFLPTKTLTPLSAADEFQSKVVELGLQKNMPQAIYAEQQQVELSACIIGANPNALATYARAYKDSVIDDSDIGFIGQRISAIIFTGTKTQTANTSHSSAADEFARRRMQDAFLWKFNNKLNRT